MSSIRKFFIAPAILVASVLFHSEIAFAQAELKPWGNIQGIRTGGELMKFETSFSVVGTGWSTIVSTGREKQMKPAYKRIGAVQESKTSIDSLHFIEEVQDVSTGKASVKIILDAHADTILEGVYFRVDLPIADYGPGKFKLTGKPEQALNQISAEGVKTAVSSGILFSSANRQLSIRLAEAAPILLKKGEDALKNPVIQIWIPLAAGKISKGLHIEKSFELIASGTVDKTPIHYKLDAKSEGRPFMGLGANFRIQNLKLDPQIIDYNLKNIHIVWSRVEMPWAMWQPEENSDPEAVAKAGTVSPRVKMAMEMAGRLGKMGIPVVLTAWFPPKWAVLGEIHRNPHFNGIWGNALNPAKMDEVYKSIASYINYLKVNYGVEPRLFSFNESDLGINVRMTGEEHLAFIKGIGTYFAAHGIKTKPLLGDNSDANTYTFIDPALHDPSSHPYIGAISFHSWRGWETATLQKWADAASQLKLPLLVGEGSIDAAGWGYPQYFLEQPYALEEINLYIRILAICQPASILQWQFTSDYSLLLGGGQFGDSSALRPTQRFWNLKQLSITPPGLFAMPLTGTGKDVSATALGDTKKGKFAFMLVNQGAKREVVLSGLPMKTGALRVYLTNKTSSMAKGPEVKVINGQAHFMLDSETFMSLFSE